MAFRSELLPSGAKSATKQPTSSLLLNPPGSGFPFHNVGGGAMLMPVALTQPESALMQELDPDADGFVNVNPPEVANEPRTFTYFQQFDEPGGADLINTNFTAEPPNPYRSLPPQTQISQVPGGPLEVDANRYSPASTSLPPPPTYSQYTSNQLPKAPTSLPTQNYPASYQPGPNFQQAVYPPTGPPPGGQHFPRGSSPSPPMYKTTSFDAYHPNAQSQHSYTPVHPHWFFRKIIEKKKVWIPFSLLDSIHLEEQSMNSDAEENVPTDGGRYNVNLHRLEKTPVYWEEESSKVRRCTWFYRMDGERVFVPYNERFAEKLEEEYRITVTSNNWHRRLEFPDGDTVVIHNSNVIVHYKNEREAGPDFQIKPRVVKRGVDDFESIEDGEPIQIDHLVFVVHGIGAFCDLKFRTLPEVVDDLRSISNSLLKSHYQKHMEEGKVGRIEFIPVSWHHFLHGDDTGIDRQLKPITLKSIPKLRHFANDTILDVLFYTSPVYCQTIISQVASEINRLYTLFLSRNPTFRGKVSFAGHSLGSVILFDLLLHQADSDQAKQEMVQPQGSLPEKNDSFQNSEDAAQVEKAESEKDDASLENMFQKLGLEEFISVFQKEQIDLDTIEMCTEGDLKEMGIPLGPRKKLLAHIQSEIQNKEIAKQREIAESSMIPETAQRRQSLFHPLVVYPKLDFDPSCFFALGSPVAMFLTVRGSNLFREDFRLPSCPAYFNIFHPFDPVAYRMEPLINANFDQKPVLIPHHKGRKRMHLEIKESLSRVGTDLRLKILESLKTTWNTIQDFALAHRTTPAQVEAEVQRMMSEEMHNQNTKEDEHMNTASGSTDHEETSFSGQLNNGRRVDYVLQEKPIESFNEYLFALQSHTCYWESEDTMLLMIKEIYAGYGIMPCSQGPDPPSKVPSVQPPIRYPPPVQFPQGNFPPSDVSFRQQQYPPPGTFQQPGVINQPNYQTPPLPPMYPASNSPFGSPGETATGRPVFGMDPTAPPADNVIVGPPPLAGFVRQSVVRK